MKYALLSGHFTESAFTENVYTPHLQMPHFSKILTLILILYCTKNGLFQIMDKYTFFFPPQKMVIAFTSQSHYYN